MRTKIITGLAVVALSVVVNAGVTAGQADAAPLTHATAQPEIVGVYVPGAKVPLEVARDSVHDVHGCYGKGYERTCRGRVVGLPGVLVFVAGVDFPHAPAGNPWGPRVPSNGWTVKHWQRYIHNAYRHPRAHFLGRLDGHARCWVIYGPTSYGECKDGHRFTS